ncbi:MAG: carboxylate--amine ligase [Chloroflexota bacterium]|nr:carboxylate--amine ligase [Chloroflexota bacterium]
MCDQILYTDTASEELAETLLTLRPRLNQKAVLFPCTDMSVLQLSRHRERLGEWYHIALPDSATIEMLLDKVGFYTYAQEAGLPIPGTFFLHTRADVEEAATALTFPCILKPPVKTPKWEQNAKEKVFKVESASELLELYDRCSEWTDVLIVQEWIEGTDADLYTSNCYFNAQSEPLVTFIARKIRQWPPKTGTGCLGVESRNDVVLEESLRLFQGVGYHGLGYVELKRDARTGKHYIIEPNVGRPTGRSAMAEAAGVDLLYTMYCDLVGWPLPSNREQAYEGVKWIYLRRDIQSALYYWRHGELTLKEWWHSIRGRRAYAVFSWRDLAPFWADWQRTATRLFTNRRRTKKRASGPARVKMDRTHETV